MRQEPPVLVVLPPPERRDDGGELLMSGCGCHCSAACLDLNMLGQCLLLKEEAMPIESSLGRSSPLCSTTRSSSKLTTARESGDG